MAREASKILVVLAIAILATVPSALGTSQVATASRTVKHVMPTLDNSVHASSRAVSNLAYHNGSIQKAPKVYLVFWGWLGQDPAGEAPYLIAFFSGIGGTPWASVQTQYSETGRGAITNPVSQLAGVWYDDALTPPPVPDALIDSEATRAADHFGYDPDANYIIATPHDINDAEFKVVYCAWHGTTTSAGHVIAYTDLPYIPDAAGSCGKNFVNAGAAGALDGVSLVAGHEYAEAVTDPHADAWYDANGNENGDKCAWNAGPGAHAQNVVLSTGTFAVQSLWSNAVSGCAIAPS